MPKKNAFELRCGAIHLTIQRFPRWLLVTTATTVGSGLAAWFTSR